jgi:CRISPR-associated protein Cas6/Cse3/CasE subtype I-E
MLLDLPLRMTTPTANRYDVHAAVYAMMLRPRSDDPRDFLFTVLPDLGGMVVVRSACFPDRLAPHAVPVDRPRLGEVRGFTLDAYPTANRQGGVPGKDRERALPPDDPEARVEWLAKRGRAHGFDLDSVTVESHRVLVGPPRGRRFFVERAEFRGELTVTDPDRLLHAMATGIGRGRAFGLGMLRWVVQA